MELKLCDFGSAKVLVLDTPTREEIKCMNPNYTWYKFKRIKAHLWHKIFHKRMPPEAVDLVSRILQFSPNLRSNARPLRTHFHKLRDPDARLPNGQPLPLLFNFKSQELRTVPPELIPDHVRRQSPTLGI